MGGVVVPPSAPHGQALLPGPAAIGGTRPQWRRGLRLPALHHRPAWAGRGDSGHCRAAGPSAQAARFMSTRRGPTRVSTLFSI